MMKRILTLLIAALLGLAILPWNAAAEFTKTKIAVLDFQMQGEKFENDDMGTIIAEWFITAMVREGRFDVVERRLLEKVINEQKLAMSGVVDATSATQLGKLLGVKVIITGSVMKLRDIIEINARIIDVESASIIAAENFRSVATTRLQDLVFEMSSKIIKNFPLEGYIVNRSGDKVTLDLGLRTGVKVGMRFVVYKEGQVIKHPKTGVVLDVERIQTGSITITTVMQNICDATIDEETSPGSVNYGQQVKSLVETKPKDASLTVATFPADARIRLLNIVPAYEPGIVLEPGPYHLEVSADGYETSREWITLTDNEQKSISVRLVPTVASGSNRQYTETKAPAMQAPAPTPARTAASSSAPRYTADQNRYIRMLNSKSQRENRDAAKLIVKGNVRDQTILDVVEQKLLSGYRSNGSDRTHIDVMAWYCKALGSSGLSKYRSTLNTVVRNAPHRKLRDHAKRSLNML